LEERYPAEVAELLDWLEQHGGARFQLGELILDGWPTRVYQMEEALTDLVNDVAAGKTRVETRLGFAGALLMADLYERSLEVVERVLGEEPENERALELWAANWRFLGRYAEAASLAREILERNPRQMRAWWTLTASLEELGEWEQVVEAATEWLAVGLERADRVIALQRRCGAYWKLGMKEESDRDLEALRALRWTKRLVGRLLQERVVVARGGRGTI
jgi:tetratricopeptide (TPR) repeat protein